jgi:DNA-binding beta-propeller fold protein YncE
VADRSNGRIQIFNGEGKFIEQWKDPAIGRPWGVTIAPDGDLFVVDGGDGYITQSKTNPNPQGPDRARVLRLTQEGKILETIGSFGRYEGQFIWPHSVAVGRDGALYVAEVHTGMRVQKFVRR